MKQRLLLLVCIFFAQSNYADSAIKKINNNSSFVFEIVSHVSQSSCGLFAGDINLYRIYPGEALEDLIIMQKGDSLALRPVAYFDNRKQQFIWMIDNNGEYLESDILNAYEAWKRNESIEGRRISKKAKTKDEWMKKWVGGNLLIAITRELRGYMLHVFHAASANYSHIDHAWPIYSKGVYSALGLIIDLEQNPKNGIFSTINTVNSDGAICENGKMFEL